jgi:hypothetical protein
MVKGHESTPYINQLILETGTFKGWGNNRVRDSQLIVDGTEALHFSDILYCQIETAKEEIRIRAPELPEFDLKKYIGRPILNEESGDVIKAFLEKDYIKEYKDDDDEFNAFADTPTTESKLRLAHRYNKNCKSIKLIMDRNNKILSTEHDFSDRNAPPK